MPIKCSVFIATSLDGFIARKNGELDWLPGSDGAAGDEDYGYRDFFDSVDTVVIGRRTYELASSFPEWPYAGKWVVVLSGGYPKAGTEIGANLTGTSMQPVELVRQLADEGAQHVYVDGGNTIQSFLRAGLIQEMTISRIPVLIGEGISLFGPLAHDIKLRHLETRLFDNGLVQSKYVVA